MTSEDLVEAVVEKMWNSGLVKGAEAISGEWFDAGNQVGICVSWKEKRHAKREYVGPNFDLMDTKWLAQTFADYFNGWAARVLRDA